MVKLWSSTGRFKNAHAGLSRPDHGSQAVNPYLYTMRVIPLTPPSPRRPPWQKSSVSSRCHRVGTDWAGVCPARRRQPRRPRWVGCCSPERKEARPGFPRRVLYGSLSHAMERTLVVPIKAAKVPSSPRPRAADRWRRWQAMVEGGMTRAEVARREGVSRAAVTQGLAKLHGPTSAP